MSTPAIRPRIVFFGSGPVAARSLKLLAAYTDIEAVVTKPRLKHHTGDVPVLELAAERGFKTFTPADRAELSAVFALKPVSSLVGVVIDYGIIISHSVINYFPKGIINSHFSLLPEWRGADPITFSILSGQSQTGISLMLIVQELDAGDLLAQTPYAIPPGTTTPALTQALIELSNQTLSQVLPLWLSGEATVTPQLDATIATSKTPTFSRKLTKQDGDLDFSKPAAQLEREVRAFIEWPKSRMHIGSLDVIVTATHVMTTPDNWDSNAGTIRLVNDRVVITTSQDLLAIDKLKPAGKAEMSISAFIAGYRRYLPS